MPYPSGAKRIRFRTKTYTFSPNQTICCGEGREKEDCEKGRVSQGEEGKTCLDSIDSGVNQKHRNDTGGRAYAALPRGALL